MLEISVDPAPVNCGIAVMKDGKPYKTYKVRFIHKDMNMTKFHDKSGTKFNSNLFRSVFKFLNENPKMNKLFSRADHLILENNALSFSPAIFYAFLAWWERHKPGERLSFVHPFAVSRWAKIGGKSRWDRKALIRKKVEEKYPEMNQKLTHDEVDAVFNWMFKTREGTKPKKEYQECHSSCSSSTKFLRTHSNLSDQDF